MFCTFYAGFQEDMDPWRSGNVSHSQSAYLKTRFMAPIFAGSAQALRRADAHEHTSAVLL